MTSLFALSLSDISVGAVLVSETVVSIEAIVEVKLFPDDVLRIVSTVVTSGILKLSADFDG